MPGDEVPSFQLTSALTGFGREFMGGYIAASSDPNTYGRITVLRFPTNTQTPGPVQVQQVYRNTQEVSQRITLIGAANVKFGNLLTLPLENGLLYVEPVYAQASAASGRSYPQLNLVLVFYGSRVGLGASIEDALKNAANSDLVVVPSDPGTPTTPSESATGTDSGSVGTTGTTTTTATLPSNANEALADVSDALNALDQAKQTGSFEEIGKAQDALNAAVEAYLTIAGAAPGTSDSGTTGATSTGG